MAERGVVWSEAETKLLLSIWMEESIQKKLSGTKRNQRVFDIISVSYFEVVYNAELKSNR